MTDTTVDFFANDIRIGTIIEAEKVANADKLLRFLVDFGTEKRQILSGIAMYYPDPTVLIGRQFAFVLSIPPRTIRGLESQGMIVAIDPSDESGIVMLTPEREVPKGSVVR